MPSLLDVPATAAECDVVSVSLVAKGSPVAVKVNNSFVLCPRPLTIEDAVPDLLLHSGEDYNVTLVLRLSHRLQSDRGRVSFHCIVTYSQT